MVCHFIRAEDIVEVEIFEIPDLVFHYLGFIGSEFTEDYTYFETVSYAKCTHQGYCQYGALSN